MAVLVENILILPSFELKNFQTLLKALQLQLFNKEVYAENVLSL